MSRIYGKAYEVYNITKDLEETKLPKYKRDNTKSSWDEIETTPEKIEIYLPDRAIDFLTSKKTKIMKTPFLKYTLKQVPEEESEERFIRFPSLSPKEEFKRELMFYMGMLLSSYNRDTPKEEYGIPNEYDDTLPLLLEYLYLKYANKEDEFSIKHLNELKGFQKNYRTFYDDYQDFQNLRREARFANLSQEKYEKFQSLCIDKEDEIISLTKDSIIQLSSLEGALGIIELLDKEDIKTIIEKLMINEKYNRSEVLQEYGIESFGYKRLRKELEQYKRL